MIKFNLDKNKSKNKFIQEHYPVDWKVIGNWFSIVNFDTFFIDNHQKKRRM